jgi:hypothetical protein
MLAIAIGILALIGLLAVCTPGEDDHSLGRIQLVSHDRDCEWDGDCGGGYYDGDRRRRGNDNRNGRNVSPGPFDRSPVEMHDVCISLDCSGRDKERDREQPEEPMGPRSLFPVPTPDGIRQFVMAAIEGGIGLGKLFANATIDFVSSLMIGIA